MTIYYAVDPYDENFRVNLKSEIYEEAVQEMEQMAGMELKVEEPDQPFEHLCTLSFSITTNHTEDDIPEDLIRSALIQRLAYLDKWARWKEEIEVFETTGGDEEDFSPPSKQTYQVEGKVTSKKQKDPIEIDEESKKE